jgi:hypothetical protein
MMNPNGVPDELDEELDDDELLAQDSPKVFLVRQM